MVRKMKLYNSCIPYRLIVDKTTKVAFTVPPDALIQNVDIYEGALDYIKCQLTNTIRHEAEHRKEEEERSLVNLPTSEVERRPESVEQACPEPNISEGNVITVNTDAVFQEAKGMSGVDPSYLQDVKAVILDDEKLGMYLAQDLPGMYDETGTQSGAFEEITDWNGNQYINVGLHFKPWLAEKKQLPPNIQFDGIETDPDLRKMQVPSASESMIPTVPSVPSIPGRGSI